MADYRFQEEFPGTLSNDSSVARSTERGQIKPKRSQRQSKYAKKRAKRKECICLRVEVYVIAFVNYTIHLIAAVSSCTAAAVAFILQYCATFIIHDHRKQL